MWRRAKEYQLTKLRLTKFRVGVDGGGTTTRAVVVNEALSILARGEAASSNLYNVGLESAVANVKTAINGALDSASLEMAQIASFGFGLAGVVSETEKIRWRTSLFAALNPISSTRFVAPIEVEEDAAAALAGAFGDEFSSEKSASGAILIAGTGANCYGQNAQGKRARADGWGPLLGDRGSGFWIGEATLRATLSAIDGAAPSTSLQKSVLEHFEVENWNALVGVVYAPDFRRDRIAALVPRVLEAAQNGDEIALRILRNAGENLACTASAVLSKLKIHRLAPTGGLLENSAIVRYELEATLKREIPHLEIVAPQYEAAVGAAILGALADR